MRQQGLEGLKRTEDKIQRKEVIDTKLRKGRLKEGFLGHQKLLVHRKRPRTPTVRIWLDQTGGIKIYLYLDIVWKWNDVEFNKSIS